MVSGPGFRPEDDVGSRMEPGIPPGVRHGPVLGPALLLRAVRERHVHVPVRGRVVRGHHHGAPVHDGRPARVEHVAPAQDEQAVLCTRGWHRRNKPAAHQECSSSCSWLLEGQKGFLFGSLCYPTSSTGQISNASVDDKFSYYEFVCMRRVDQCDHVKQVVLWVAIPALLERGSTTAVMTVLLIMFLFQYLPKIYHSVCLLRRMQNLSGYIFGTVWWGIALNMIAYFVASHAVGACWYLLGIQRAAKCLQGHCRGTKGCGLRMLACEDPIYYGTTSLVRDRTRLLWGDNKQVRSACLENDDNFDFGAYKWTVQLVTNESRLEKILFPIFWGLMTLRYPFFYLILIRNWFLKMFFRVLSEQFFGLDYENSTFGNLESTTDCLEVVFIIIVLTTGLLLVTMLIGNIKVFLHATTSKKQAMQLKMRNIEWWMRRRHLPPAFKQRVRNYERQRWAAMRGVDECEMIKNLPEGLRRDIKYHLCLDLVRQVPLFQHMDNLVLENICDRVKSLIFTKGETITREGDPVQRMLFIVRGHLQSSQLLRDGVESCCMLGPGNFSGDELLSWCLRRPFVERLPPSSSTLVTLETTEAFGLESEDVKYVTQHFRYTFVNEKVKRSARYYSPGWRTWAAVAIQLAWRRYRHRLTLTSLSFIRPRRPLSRCSSLGEDRLRLYTALLTSPKPNQDDFDF
ncbi:hypothetical protein RHSIM_Rhsim06G0192600 [Rhododendron simsii]|uniref:Cyclic nucleotide-binding domain-containing protein n=1 Tax=Rhododendron simsii TaxID=118357 RepID=A0A834H1S2_RHOSS|nr:hypothetical protein RHSIM_Rhsim06G0192600 [Rhododendron simsii]